MTKFQLQAFEYISLVGNYYTCSSLYDVAIICHCSFNRISKLELSLDNDMFLFHNSKPNRIILENLNFFIHLFHDPTLIRPCVGQLDSVMGKDADPDHMLS